MGDQGHADHLLGYLAGFLGAMSKADAPTLAPAASVYLSLEDYGVNSQLLGNLVGLLRVEGYLPSRNRNLITG